MTEKKAPGEHPGLLPGFEAAYYPPEWVYYDVDWIQEADVRRLDGTHVTGDILEK